jgi:hypothetical protein
MTAFAIATVMLLTTVNLIGNILRLLYFHRLLTALAGNSEGCSAREETVRYLLAVLQAVSHPVPAARRQ